ncbi:MAG: 4Fe-4S dicluster domain-containing protein, partial [Planctomycetes bacterium]|nr:4Fe-4S dicluster domain-containing protein [Planctomycetota bacterium]
RFVIRPKELESRTEDWIILGLISVIVITGFLLEGFRMSVTELSITQKYWSPAGWLTAHFVRQISLNVASLYPFVWFTHSTLVIIFIAYIPFSKLAHIFFGPLNIFFTSLDHKGTLKRLDLEHSERFGVSGLGDFSWKDLMDVDTCVRCGRCETGCPTYLSEKPLTPKKFINEIKDELTVAGPAGKVTEPLCERVVTSDEIWVCTTCGFCREACPLLIEQPPKILELRRNLVLSESRFPAEVKTIFKNMETNGNPWAVSWDKRADWIKGLDVKILNEGDKTDILLWVGCAGATDDRNTKVATALVKILQKSGVDFAILGNAEKCCGDPARRIGNEYLYETIALENIELLKKYHFRQILTYCPHCYNTLKNEYHQLDGDFDIAHHSEFILGLINAGKLNITPELKSKITYHDSCYLGRYNNIYDAPRRVLGSTGADIKEMPRRRRDSFCCGAGGGRMWMEEKLGKRINRIRTEEARKTLGPNSPDNIIATACPYCLTMLEDGIKETSTEAGAPVKARDIGEIIAESLRV